MGIHLFGYNGGKEGVMAIAEDLTKLDPAKRRALLEERLKLHFTLGQPDHQSTLQKLVQHYEKLNVFPKSLPTLDVSIKALVKMWQRGNQPTARL